MQHVARLRQWAFAGIHKQEHAIDHAQRAFHFAAKVAVTRGVHDVDFGVMKKQRGVFGENGDAPFAFQIVGIHDAFHQRLVGAKNSALPQHGIHEGGLPVVYVRDDGDVANILTHKILASSGRAAASH